MKAVCTEGVFLHLDEVISADGVNVGALHECLQLLFGLVQIEHRLNAVEVFANVVFVFKNSERAVNLVFVHFYYNINNFTSILVLPWHLCTFRKLIFLNSSSSNLNLELRLSYYRHCLNFRSSANYLINITLSLHQQRSHLFEIAIVLFRCCLVIDFFDFSVEYWYCCWVLQLRSADQLIVGF